MSNCLYVCGMSIQDGERIGCIFETARLFFGIYSQDEGCIIWEDDGSKSPTDFRIMFGIEKWLEDECVKIT